MVGLLLCGGEISSWEIPEGAASHWGLLATMYCRRGIPEKMQTHRSLMTEKAVHTAEACQANTLEPRSNISCAVALQYLLLPKLNTLTARGKKKKLEGQGPFPQSRQNGCLELRGNKLTNWFWKSSCRHPILHKLFQKKKTKERNVPTFNEASITWY